MKANAVNRLSNIFDQVSSFDGDLGQNDNVVIDDTGVLKKVSSKLVGTNVNVNRSIITGYPVAKITIDGNEIILYSPINTVTHTLSVYMLLSSYYMEVPSYVSCINKYIVLSGQDLSSSQIYLPEISDYYFDCWIPEENSWNPVNNNKSISAVYLKNALLKTSKENFLQVDGGELLIYVENKDE